MEYNEYLFVQLAEFHLMDYFEEYYNEYDCRFPFIQKLYDYFQLTDDGDGNLYTKIEDFLFERKAEIEKYGVVKLNSIKKKVFLDWVFDDFSGDAGIFFSDYLYEKLFNEGKFTLTIDDIIETVEYIPGHLCETRADGAEYDPKEVEII